MIWCILPVAWWGLHEALTYPSIHVDQHAWLWGWPSSTSWRLQPWKLHSCSSTEHLPPAWPLQLTKRHHVSMQVGINLHVHASWNHKSRSHCIQPLAWQCYITSARWGGSMAKTNSGGRIFFKEYWIYHICQNSGCSSEIYIWSAKRGIAISQLHMHEVPPEQLFPTSFHLPSALPDSSARPAEQEDRKVTMSMPDQSRQYGMTSSRLYRIHDT